MMQVQTEPGVHKIRIGEITGGFGQLFPEQPNLNESFQANVLYISCDQASNLFNSEGRNAPIVAIL